MAARIEPAQQTDSAHAGSSETNLTLNVPQEGNFERDGYVVARRVFDSNSLDIYTNYVLMLDSQDFKRSEKKHGFRDRYADTLMESLLLHLQPAMERATGLG